ncbi:MAG: PQQ-dependent sugar dehydrogenase, partial [Bacteroidota bacterium]
MKIRHISLLLLLCGTYFLALPATLPPGFAEMQIADSLNPTAMTIAPDGRLFLAQKDGRILIVRNDSLLPDPFFDLVVDETNERGLGSIALHPDFDQNPYVYIYYTVPGQNRNRISRLTANGDFAIPGSEEILLELSTMLGSIHNGGGMAFGKDGKLYVCTGDGNGGAASQSLSSFLGKVIRLNPDGSIPTDNPFYNDLDGDFRAIYATGLRNPFTMSIDPISGRIFVNDVGNGSFEEINEILPGKDYGWPILEGNLKNQSVSSNYQDPFKSISHVISCAIMGSAFYAPSENAFPGQYQGKYLFGDYCRGYIKTIDPQTGIIEETFAENIDRLVALLVSPQGDLYYLERAGMGGGSVADNTSSNTGRLWKISYTGSGAPFISVQPKDILVPQGEDALFHIRASGADPLQYQWYLDGQPLNGANDDSLLLTNLSLAQDDQVLNCVVSNAEGSLNSLEATLSVTSNQRPEPTIAFPEGGTTYMAGETLSFNGYANDPEDGPLPPAQLSWTVIFHHDTHT